MKEYALPEEVLAEIDRLEAEVAGRLRAIREAVPGAAPLVDSVLADHERHRGARARLARRLHIPRPAAAGVPSRDRSLAGLRTALEALTHAHAEGLPALRDAGAVDLLARHMVTAARHLTVIDLWIEAEDARA